jgi:hypothetical protein
MTIVIPTLQTERWLLLPPSAAAEALYCTFYTDARRARSRRVPHSAAGRASVIALGGYGVDFGRRRPSWV